MKFKLGQTVMTQGIAAAMKESSKFEREVREAFNRYVSGDWGDLGWEDREMNDLAVIRKNDRIFAKYETSVDPIYIITEWDRSATTVLFTYEY